MTITTFGLTSTATQGVAPFAFGHAFKQGDVPAGSAVVADFPEFQATPVATWPDGSLRFAQLSGRAALTANTPLTVTLSTGTPTGGTALTTADLKATGITATIGASTFGSVSWATTDWDSPFQTVPGVDALVSGPQMSSWRYRKAIPGDAHLVGWLEVRLYASGAVEILPWIENGYLMVTAPTNKNAVYSFSINGVERFSSRVGHLFNVNSYTGGNQFTIAGGPLGAGPTRISVGLLEGAATQTANDGNGLLTYSVAWDGAVPSTMAGAKVLGLPNHSRTPLVSGAALTHWMGTDPAVTPSHDPAYLQSTDLVPVYSTVASSSTLNSHAQTYTPLMQGSFPNAMGSGGYDKSIGPLPEWDVGYVTTGDPRGYRAVVVHGYAAGRYGIHFRDETTNRPLRLTSRPTLVLDGSSSVVGTGASSANLYTPSATGPQPPVWNETHNPSVGLLAYLLTGWHYFIEETQFAAITHVLKNTDTFRRSNSSVASTGSAGVLETEAGANTTRGVAWAWRTLAQAVALSPDNDIVKVDLQASLEANINRYWTRYIAPSPKPNELGFVAPYVSYTSGHYSLSAWQQDFFTMSTGYMLSLRPSMAGSTLTRLKEFFAWKAKSIINRLGRAGVATDWSYRDAAAYEIAVSPVASPTPLWDNPASWPYSWQEMYEHPGRLNTDPDGNLRGGNFPEGTSYWANLQGAIAYAVKHNAPGATEAYQRMATAPNYNLLQASMAITPVWSVAPGATTTEEATMPAGSPCIVMDSASFLASGVVMDANRYNGILAGAIPSASGQTHPHPLANDPQSGDPAGSRYAYEVKTVPAGLTTFTRNQDGSIIATGPDGMHVGEQYVKFNGVRTVEALNVEIGAASTITGITISPTTATGSMTFTKNVTGTGSFSNAATFSKISGGGSIDASTGVFTAPAQTSSIQIIVVRVTSTQDPSRTADATITIAAIVAGSTISGVTVSPGSATGSTTFAANVAGTGSYSSAVTWSIVSGPGSINASTGAYVAPAQTGSVQTTIVRATSTQDGTKQGNATVTIAATGTVAPPSPTVSSVTVSPSSGTINAGSTRQYSAAVAGANSPGQGVTWAASSGSITTGGLFTPPAATSSLQTITITATSTVDGTKSGTAIIYVNASAISAIVANGNMLEIAADGSILNPTESNYYLRGRQHFIDKDPEAVMFYGVNLASYLARAGNDIGIVAVEARPVSVDLVLTAAVQGARLVAQIGAGTDALAQSSIDAAPRCTFHFTLSNGDEDDFTIWFNITNR